MDSAAPSDQNFPVAFTRRSVCLTADSIRLLVIGRPRRRYFRVVDKLLVIAKVGECSLSHLARRGGRIVPGWRLQFRTLLLQIGSDLGYFAARNRSRSGTNYL